MTMHPISYSQNSSFTKQFNTIGIRLLNALFFTFLIGVSWGQVWTYDFGTVTGSFTSGTPSESFLPNPPSGTDRVRVGTNPGSISLVNPGIGIGTGSELQITSNTGSSSTTKFSIYDYTASKVGYVKFKIAFSGGTNGVYYFSIGDGSGFNDNNQIATTQIFTGIKFSLLTSNAVTYEVLNASSYGNTGISNSATLFSQSTSNEYVIEVYFNNTTTSTNYIRSGSTNSVANAKWDLWVNGSLIGNDLSKGGLGSNVNIDSYAINHQVSATTPGTVYIDDIEYSNSLPQPTITGAATATAFTTTYGTPSTAQTFSISGSNLTAGITATAPTGFEVSSDGTSYGGTATFNQSSGSASGTLRIRLTASAAVGLYDNQNITLSSTGATSVNITTSASGNSVSAIVPTAPTITGITAGNAQLSVAFTAPTSNGGASISNYAYSIDNGVNFTACSPFQTTSPILITGLSNGTTYDVQIRAVNSAGSGAATASTPGTPVAPSGPVITASATLSTFSTIYGTSSAAQSFSVSGATLNDDILATAPIGFEVSSDDITYGSTVTFTQTSGSASGTVWVRLAATAEVGLTYNSQQIVLSSTGATNVNISTSASGNTVSKKALTITAGNQTVSYGTAIATVTANGTFNPTGFVNGETAAVIGGSATYTTTYTTTTAAGASAATITPVTTNLTASNYSFTAANGNITVTAVVPSSPAITSITAGNAQLSVAFTSPSSNGGSSVSNYEFSIDGGTNWTTPSPSVVSSPILITGLTNGTTYNVQLRAVNTAGAGAATASTQGTPFASPANDLCANAISLPVDGTSTSGTLLGATNTANTFSYGSSKPDVWYKFTTSCSGIHTIDVAFSAGPDIDFDVFTSSTCVSSGTAPITAHGTDATSESVSSSLVGATTYYIRLIDFNLDAGAFTIIVTPPVNINQAVSSAAATSIAVTGATLNGNVTALGNCPATSEKGFVYSLTSANADPIVGGAGVTKTPVSGIVTGTYTLALSSLTAASGYTFKAYVYNGTNYVYGAATNFSTLATHPTAQPTVFSRTSVSPTSMSIGWVAATGSPSGYLVLRTTASGTTYPNTDPVDGTFYTAGNTLGNATVEYVGSNLSAAISSLSALSRYNYEIFSYNGSGSTVNYLITTPLTGQPFTLANEPTAQPTTLTLTNITSTSASLTVSGGNGSGVAVFMKAGSAVDFIPTDGVSITADAAFGSGTQYGTGNYLVLLSEAAAFTVSITGLTASTSYSLGVYAYNGLNSNVSSNFYATPAVTSFSTLATAPTTQPTAFTQTAASTSAMTVAWTAAAGTPDGYLLLRTTNSSATHPNTNPVDGTVYTQGDILGNATVEYLGSNLSAAISNLAAGSQYSYEVYSYNGSGSSINYNISGPLQAWAYTLATEPTAHAASFTATATAATNIDLAFSAASTLPASGYLILKKSTAFDSGDYPIDGNAYSVGAAVGANGAVVNSVITSASVTTSAGTSVAADNTYFYLLVPFNWTGSASATRNYFTGVTIPTANATTPSGATDAAVVLSSESASISSLINDVAPLGSANGVQVWQFSIRDGGSSLNDADALPTKIASITLTQNVSSNVSSWNTSIKTVALFDGTTLVATGTVGNPTNNIVFSSLSLSIPDGQSKTLSVRLSLNNSLGVTDDGKKFVFNLTNANLVAVADGTSSGVSAFSAINSSTNSNVIAVVATQLSFLQQPSNSNVSIAMSPAVTVEADDANGNRDLDYTTSISLVSSGTMSTSPLTATPSAGLATFNNVTHQIAGNGLQLTATSGAFSAVLSNTFNVVLTPVTIYKHDFEGALNSPALTIYSAAPPVIDANLNTSQWTSSTSNFVNYNGVSSTNALSLNTTTATATYTLTFNVATGYQMSLTAFEFWRQRSANGHQNWSLTVNGATAGTGTIPTSGALVTTNNLNFQGITGAVSIVLTISTATGSGTFRLDDFTLIGNVTCLTPSNKTITAGAASLCDGSSTNISVAASQIGVNYQLRNNANNATIGSAVAGTGSTINLPTGNLNSTTTFNVLATSTCGLSSSMTTTPMVSIVGSGLWVGGNGNWSAAANWCGNIVPNAAASNATVSDAVVVHIDVNLSLNQLTIGSLAQVILDQNIELTLTGTLTNEGAFTLKDGATFVPGTSGTSVAGAGTFNVEKQLTGNATTWDTPNNVGRFWYLGVPMNSVARSSFGTYGSTSNRVWSYNEVSKQYTEVTDGNSLLTGGTGYVHRRNDNNLFTFSATGANGLRGTDLTLSGLTRTSGSSVGFHLIANPYMAYLDWEAVTSSNIEPTYYIRSNGSNNISALISCNSSNDQYVSTAGVLIDEYTDVRYIAPLQSIWVRVGPNSGTGSLSMTRSMLSHQANNPGLKNTTAFPTLARVNLVDGPRFDQLLVFMNEYMTNAVDQYDSEKMFVSGAPQIYTMAAGKKLVMNGLNSNKKKISVPLYLELPTSKVYELQLANYNLEDGLILLEDKQEGTIQDFTINDTYAFYANSGVLQNRFVLHFFMPDATITAQGPSNSWAEEEGSYTEGGNILISSDSKGKVQISLDQPETEKVEGTVQATDANGKVVYKGALEGLMTVFQLNVPSGIYYLTVQSGNIIENQKVFIQE